MLALAATMTEEDSPVVPSPDDLDASPDLWSTPLGRAMTDDMRADEAAQEGSHYDFNEGQGHGYDGRYESSAPVLTRYAKLDAALTGAVGGSLNFMIGGPSNGKVMWTASQARRAHVVPTEHDAQASFAAARAADRMISITYDRSAARPEQRAAKKARAKRKAKKGWA